MNALAFNRGGASALPLPIILSDIASYQREVIEQLVSGLIEHLDGMDGDSEVEPGFSEDDATPPPWCPDGYRGRGPGCPISDPFEEDDPSGGSVDDEGEAEEHDGGFAGGFLMVSGRMDHAALVPFRDQPHHDLDRIEHRLRGLV